MAAAAAAAATRFLSICALLQRHGYKMLIFTKYRSFEPDEDGVSRALQSVAALLAPSLHGFPRTPDETAAFATAFEERLGSQEVQDAAMALPGGDAWLEVHDGFEPLAREENVVTYARRCAADCGRAMQLSMPPSHGCRRTEAEFERFGAQLLADPLVGALHRSRFYPWDPTAS